MSNEWLWFIVVIVNFSMLVFAYKIFGKYGLLAWIAMGTILANIQVIKFIELFGMTATLGNILFGSLFLATDTLSEKYGLKEAKRAVWLGFFTLAVTVIIMQFALWFEPFESQEAQSALETIFNFIPRIAGASLIAYLISQMLDVHLFQKIKARFSSHRLLFVRNLGSTMISQAVDTLIFVPLAFIGTIPTAILIDIIITTYIIKLIVALLDTPFIYLMKSLRPLNE